MHVLYGKNPSSYKGLYSTTVEACEASLSDKPVNICIVCTTFYMSAREVECDDNVDFALGRK